MKNRFLGKLVTFWHPVVAYVCCHSISWLYAILLVAHSDILATYLYYINTIACCQHISTAPTAQQAPGNVYVLAQQVTLPLLYLY